jgi:hypothetical protein
MPPRALALAAPLPLCVAVSRAVWASPPKKILKKWLLLPCGLLLPLFRLFFLYFLFFIYFLLFYFIFPISFSEIAVWV